MRWPRAGPVPPFGPLPNDTVLLPHSCFVLEPDFDPSAARQVTGGNFRIVGKFFESDHDGRVLSQVARPSAAGLKPDFFRWAETWRS